MFKNYNQLFLILFFPIFICHSFGIIVGGWTKSEDVNDVKDIAHKAVGLINEQSNNIYTLKLIDIKEVYAQIVAGVKYNMTLDIGKTRCLKQDGFSVSLEECEFNSEEMVENCEVTVWDRSWLNKTELLSFSCTPSQKYSDYKRIN